MSEQSSELVVGTLRFDLSDPVRRCGLHGDSTESGRCSTCDSERRRARA